MDKRGAAVGWPVNPDAGRGIDPHKQIWEICTNEDGDKLPFCAKKVVFVENIKNYCAFMDIML